jgi:hypothetical protein
MATTPTPTPPANWDYMKKAVENWQKGNAQPPTFPWSKQ